MNLLTKKKSLGSFVVLSVLSVIWLFPTVGLFVTSIREKTEAQRTGWWDVLLHPFTQNWEFGSYAAVISEKNIGTSILIHNITR